MPPDDHLRQPEFDAELGQAIRDLQVSTTAAREGSSNNYSLRYASWLNSADHPQIIADIYVVDAEGDRFAITTARGDSFTGAVVTHSPGREFSGTVDSFHDSLLRIALESCFGRPEAWIWLSTWGAPGAEVDALESRLRSLLSALFPEPAGARAAV